jgi:hypothetical protein
MRRKRRTGKCGTLRFTFLSTGIDRGAASPKRRLAMLDSTHPTPPGSLFSQGGRRAPSHAPAAAATRDVSYRRPGSSVFERTSCRRLALRVIDQAFRDLASPAGVRADKESARAFLAGSSMLYHWCQVADLDPAWMVARARKLISSAERFSTPAVKHHAPKGDILKVLS